MSASTATTVARIDDGIAPEEYLQCLGLIQQLQRYILEVVKLELEARGYHDINNVQALMLFRVGDFVMTVGELTLRGCYLGSNVSYNVKKMVENGYLLQERSTFDRRSIRIRLAEKGKCLRGILIDLFNRHAGILSGTPLTSDSLRITNATLHRFERFLIRMGDNTVL